MIDFLDGFVQKTYSEDEDLLGLWQAAKAMNVAVEVYTENC
jgi:hypothetical protein